MSLKTILEIQEFKSLKIQKKEYKRQINFDKLLESKTSKIRNTKLTIQKLRYYQIKKQKKKRQNQSIKNSNKYYKSKD